MSQTATAASTLTTRDALTAAARRTQEFIEAAQRKLAHAHSLARLAQHEDDVITAAKAAELADIVIRHTCDTLQEVVAEGADLDPALDAISRPAYWILRAFEIDFAAGPEGPFIDRDFGNYDAIPIGELARQVKAIMAAELAAAEAAELAAAEAAR